MTTVVGESPLVPTAYTPGTGESAITKDVVATAQVGSVSRSGAVIAAMDGSEVVENEVPPA